MKTQMGDHTHGISIEMGESKRFDNFDDDGHIRRTGTLMISVHSFFSNLVFQWTDSFTIGFST